VGVMAEEGKDTVSTMEAHIHPLVVMSLADHHTRERLQYKKDRAVGLLFGKQKGTIVTVFESQSVGDMSPESLASFEKADLENFKQIYPDYECVGWYSTGGQIRPEDSKIHTSITKGVEEEKEGSTDWRSEHPMFILLDPSPKDDQRDLPLQVFEESVRIVGDKRKSEFVTTPFKITSDEAERVTVVHCARVITGDEGKEQSAVVTPYTTLKKSTTSLNDRLRILVKFLEDVKTGKVKADQKVLRKVKALCNRLPTMNSPAFRDDFFSEYNDALLVTYLASITKSQTALSDLVEKFNMSTFGGSHMQSMAESRGKGPQGSGGLGSYFGGMGMGMFGF